MSYYSTSPLDEIKKTFRQNRTLSALILINTGVWVLVKAVEVIFYLFNQPGSEAADIWVLNYFALPAWSGSLALRPWTFVSYMFLHIDFWHILFNMLWLFWFGKIFLEFMSSRQLLITYFAGGLSGGLLYIVAFNIFPVFRTILPESLALGASASVMAIVMATAFYVPDYSIQLILFGKVKIIYMAIILFVIDFFAIPSGNAGGHLAHIGGALWGFSYVLIIRRGLPGFSFGSLSIPSWLKSMFMGRRMHVSHKDTGPGRPLSDDQYNYEKNLHQKRIDSILEKIAKGGYDSLTKEEKELLFKSSGKKQ